MMQTWRDTSSAQAESSRAYAGAIGSSPAWQRVLAAAVRVATTEATVLLQGESGTEQFLADVARSMGVGCQC
jgi:transcriptional regulator with GAF, ATPase, and Fis domain